MSEDIFQQVVGRSGIGNEAILKGFMRRGLRGLSYPGMIANQQESVRGLIYHQLSQFEFDRLDTFEGSMYYRRNVQVLLNEQVIPCFTYVLRDQYHNLLAENDWNFSEFLRDRSQQFGQDYDGWTNL